jgi:hypothetical protein
MAGGEPLTPALNDADVLAVFPDSAVRDIAAIIRDGTALDEAMSAA